MRSKPEATIEKYLTDAVRNNGGHTIKLEGYKGIPDRLIILPGKRMFFVELKRPEGGTISEAQKAWHKWLRSCQQPVFVIKNKDEVDALITDIVVKSMDPQEAYYEQ